MPKTSAKRAPRLGREAWLDAARDALIVGGVASVKVEPLAASLGVTTGSFYWHFEDRPALLAALLQHWIDTNTRGLVNAVAQAGESGEHQFDAIVDVWINEIDFSPAYDAAMRDWARTSPEVDAAVRAVDRRRLSMLKSIFRTLGFSEKRAEVRARVMYYHQVGYYALNIIETRATREKLLRYYVEVLRDGVGKSKR